MPGAQVTGDLSNPVLDVLPPQVQRGTVIPAALESDVNMRVFGIVVLHRSPFKLCTEIVPYALHEIARQARQIDAIAEFWRNDKLP